MAGNRRNIKRRQLSGQRNPCAQGSTGAAPDGKTNSQGKGKKTGRTCSQRTGTGGKAGTSAETHAGMDSAGESGSLQ